MLINTLSGCIYQGYIAEYNYQGYIAECNYQG